MNKPNPELEYYYDKELLERFTKNAGESIDNQIRDVLTNNSYTHSKFPTGWELFKRRLSWKITQLRVRLAEWIGGETLHEDCGY